MTQNSSRLFVISAPSGTGKTSVFKKAKEIFPALTLSISCTTRNPREGEQNGVEYYFISKEAFEKRIEHEDFLEWAEVYGNYYGTSRSFIEESTRQGNLVILDIDVQGALQLMDKTEIDIVFIFITPPSLEVLKHRLTSRGTETDESLEKRLGAAAREMSFKDRYDFIIENDDLEKAADDFLTILLKEYFDFYNKTPAEIESFLQSYASTGKSGKIKEYYFQYPQNRLKYDN